MFPADPGHFGPYGPSSRAFLNALYIAVDRVPEFAESSEARSTVASEDFQRRLAYARGIELVDYPAVAALKMPVLNQLYALFARKAAAHPRNSRATAGASRVRFAFMM